MQKRENVSKYEPVIPLRASFVYRLNETFCLGLEGTANINLSSKFGNDSPFYLGLFLGIGL